MESITPTLVRSLPNVNIGLNHPVRMVPFATPAPNVHVLALSNNLPAPAPVAVNLDDALISGPPTHLNGKPVMKRFKPAGGRPKPFVVVNHQVYRFAQCQFGYV